jgi:hypothetical protein
MKEGEEEMQIMGGLKKKGDNKVEKVQEMEHVRRKDCLEWVKRIEKKRVSQDWHFLIKTDYFRIVFNVFCFAVEELNKKDLFGFQYFRIQKFISVTLFSGPKESTRRLEQLKIAIPNTP